MDWQPIETLPEREGWLLVWCDPKNAGDVEAGLMGVARRAFVTRDGKSQRSMKDWRWELISFQPLNIVPPVVFDGTEEHRIAATPTHWMPWPDPPRPQPL